MTNIFLRPNTTSSLQSTDQGVTRSLKSKCRTKVVQKMINAIDNDKSLPTISVTEVMKMFILAWGDVSITTVQRCFKKPSFSDEEKNSDFNGPFSTFKQ